MTKQKHGLWVFLFSLIPGAGEMYMGFRKQGLSIMFLFWLSFAIASGTGMGWIIMFLPILWFYSFFNVHNLKSLDEEDFFNVEDTYILHLDNLIGDADDLLKGKYRNLIAVLLIFFGISLLWNCAMDFLYWFLPSALVKFLNNLAYQIPQIIIAIAIIYLGLYILSGKKKNLESTSEPKQEARDEHYWEPYRPFQQAKEEVMNRAASEEEPQTENTETKEDHTPQTLDGTAQLPPIQKE